MGRWTGKDGEQLSELRYQFNKTRKKLRQCDDQIRTARALHDPAERARELDRLREIRHQIGNELYAIEIDRCRAKGYKFASGDRKQAREKIS